MICCINPDCPNPQNPDGQTYCISCGVKLVPILRSRYRVLKPIGQGGFGRTYLAEDIDKLNRPCVVKQLVPNGQGTWAINKAIELFEQEARQLEKLGETPQIPHLYAYFKEGNYLYLVQQFIDGNNLLDFLEYGGIWQETQVKQMLLDLLPVLTFIHEQSIIHRDIKPENIMRRSSDGLLVLIDFGASKELSGTVMFKPGTRIGSQGYAAFEQMQGGEADPASDLFSLGATAFHLLTGIHPFSLWVEHGYSWTANWQQHLIKPIDNGLALILNRLLAKYRQQRYQSAEEVLKDFQSQSRLTPLQTFYFQMVRVTFYAPGKMKISRENGRAQFISEDLGSGIILEMVSIPEDSFVMGSPDTEAGKIDNQWPQHEITVAPFFMGKYEVTQEQWEAVMGNNPSNFKGAKRPVENVTWNDAVEFCQKLSIKTGKTYRLPSEAEWEYACRAGTTTPLYFGEGETITPDLVNCDGYNPYGYTKQILYRKQTTDVGSFPPNAFGLYDMHGNVWEWCSDKWHPNYNRAPTDGSSWETGRDNNRVMRGGSWNTDVIDCGSAHRGRNLADHRWWSIGFRVALALALPASPSSL